MNKRQRKKKWKKETPAEFQLCQWCGRKLNPFDEWGIRYGACNTYCYATLVGANLTF